MDTFICNKCFATTRRGKIPFCLIQCGHIYCNGCVRQAEKQCAQCQERDTFSIELRQPSLSKVESFFTPLDVLLESLNKVHGFQSTQTKIVMQRLYEIDKKYESLKTAYCNLVQHLKILQNENTELKAERAEQQKKLASMEMHNTTMNSLRNRATPVNTNIKGNKQRNISSSGYSSHGTGSSYMSFNAMKDHKTSGGFRIPRPTSSTTGSHFTSDINSTYTFRP